VNSSQEDQLLGLLHAISEALQELPVVLRKMGDELDEMGGKLDRLVEPPPIVVTSETPGPSASPDAGLRRRAVSCCRCGCDLIAASAVSSVAGAPEFLHHPRGWFGIALDGNGRPSMLLCCSSECALGFITSPAEEDGP